MEFEPVRSSSLQDAIYQQLLDAITSGRLHPGERLALEVVARTGWLANDDAVLRFNSGSVWEVR